MTLVALFNAFVWLFGKVSRTKKWTNLSSPSNKNKISLLSKTYKKLGGGDLDDARSLRSLSRSRLCGGLILLRLDWLGLDFFGEREYRFDLRLLRISGDLERDRDFDLLLLRLFDLLKKWTRSSNCFVCPYRFHWLTGNVFCLVYWFLEFL